MRLVLSAARHVGQSFNLRAGQAAQILRQNSNATRIWVALHRSAEMSSRGQRSLSHEGSAEITHLNSILVTVMIFLPSFSETVPVTLPSIGLVQILP